MPSLMPANQNSMYPIVAALPCRFSFQHDVPRGIGSVDWTDDGAVPYYNSFAASLNLNPQLT